jgi:diacylglycerol kinase (ATP)
MRAAAILGPGNLSRSVVKFQRASGAQWTSLIKQADVVVIFGGDGTVHHNLPALVNLQTPVLVVPCGSGNDFARALRLRSVSDSVKAWQQLVANGSNVRTIDLGLIQEPAAVSANSGEISSGLDQSMSAQHPAQHYFSCIAGVGLDAEITRRANELPKWLRAHGGYALSSPREFLRFAPFPMKISCNGAAADKFQPTILAAIANAPAYGGGMKIAPHAQLDDGKLDLCIVRAMGTFKLFCLFPTVYFGRHLRFDEVEYTQTPQLRIETESPLDVYADGEYVCKTPVKFSIARNALKVIVPG